MDVQIDQSAFLTCWTTSNSIFMISSIQFDNFNLLGVRLSIMLACVLCYMTSLLLVIPIFFPAMDLRILQVSFENHAVLVQ